MDIQPNDLLRDLLRDVANKSNENEYTHLTMYDPRQRWMIPAQNITSFWQKYCGLINENPNVTFSLAERANSNMPLIVDITLRFLADNSENWEPYDDHFLHVLVHCYQECIIKNFHISETKIELICCVLESEHPWEEEDDNINSLGERRKYLIFKIRLQFPYCRIDASVQKRVIFPQAIQLLRNKNPMGILNHQPIGDLEQIINVIGNNPVTLYGSETIPNHPRTILSRIWGYISEDACEGHENIINHTIETIFIPINHQHVQNGIVPENMFNQYPKEYWLPLFFSINYWPTIVLPKTSEINNLHTPTFDTTRGFLNNKNHDNEDSQTPIEMSEKFLSMLNNSRFTNYSSWLEIGKSLFNSDEGGNVGLHLWVRHTRRATKDIPELPKFLEPNLEDTCRNLYYTFSTSSTTVKTLAWYANEDCPRRFDDWHKSWCLSAMEKATSCLHTDIANCLRRVYWLQFVCASITTQRWYQFKNNRWIEGDKGVTLRNCISNDFLRRFEAVRNEISQQKMSSSDERFRDEAEITINKIGVLIKKLKTVTFKNCIMREAMDVFYHPQFLSLLDANPDLTGMTDGVLEVCGSEVIFRKGKPEDFISKCTGNSYRRDFTWEHPLVRECKKWLQQVFTDDDLYQHFMRFSASGLKGRNSDKIFSIWTGGGENSKSMIVKLFEAAFGPYAIKMPISLLTGKRSASNSATPEMARARSAKYVFLQEPEDEESMRKGIVKEMTGGDSFFARLLHENGGDVQAFFKMILMCNKVPMISNADNAVKNRTRLLPFLSKWIDNPPINEEEQYKKRLFKKNPIFERRIPIMAPAFMWMIVQFFPAYNNEGLGEPEIVSITTEKYWRDNDIYMQFTGDAIVNAITENGEQDLSARLTLNEVYAEFKAWYRDAFPGARAPERPTVRNELIQRWGPMHGNSWYGIRISVEQGNVPPINPKKESKISLIITEKPIGAKISNESTFSECPEKDPVRRSVIDDKTVPAI